MPKWPMTVLEYIDALRELQVSTSLEAARLLGISELNARAYALGKKQIPRWLAQEIRDRLVIQEN